MSINRFNRSNTSTNTRVNPYSEELVQNMAAEVTRRVQQTVKNMTKSSIKHSGNIFYLNPEKSGGYVH